MCTGLYFTDAVKTCFINEKKGECIQKWLCDNDTIITNGLILSKKVVEFRYGDAGECGDYMMQCCLLRKKEIPTPEIRKGCGWANPGGVGFSFKGYDGETNFAEFPWAVALAKKTEFSLGVGGQQIYSFLGGGSLIHPQVVLTAAHYVFDKPADVLKVTVGEWDRGSVNEPNPHQERTVQEVVAHPNFNKNGVYDVSLLYLASPVSLAANVGVACLAPAGARAAAGARCVATGWGKISNKSLYAQILKRVEVPVVDRWQCQTKLRHSDLGRHYELDASVMCAGGDGLDTCKGDGGAPLVCPSSTPNRYVQYGIVSWGIGCSTYPGVYSDVGYLRGWIDDSMRSHHFDPSEYSLDSHDN